MILQPGDFFRISSRRMAASGTVTKVNRATVSWQADVQFRPDGPIYHQTGKIEKSYFERGTLICRGEAAFTLL